MAELTTPRLFLVTYKPLVYTRFGRAASQRHAIPPFVDGSIRREPDLQHPVPAISCLCRADKFAPRLVVGDEVVYLTAKGRYGAEGRRHWRLTAHLRVVRLFDSHADAAGWYRAHGYELPNNCMVAGNEAVPLGHSSMIRRAAHVQTLTGDVGCTEAAAHVPGSCGARGGCAQSERVGAGDVHARWDRIYQRRARRHGRFVACEPLFVDLSWDAPVVREEDLVHAFGYLPGTRNPGAMPVESAERLKARLVIHARPPSP
jgi:hypothetical protein